MSAGELVLALGFGRSAAEAGFHALASLENGFDPARARYLLEWGAIAALLVAADLAELHGEPASAAYLRETADAWNTAVEQWTYVSGSDLARQVGVSGYYVRIAPPEAADASSPQQQGFVPIKNRPPGEARQPPGHIVSPDALALVRFGLRSADDPRIAATVKVIDAPGGLRRNPPVVNVEAGGSGP